jgi:hypothetical protein
MDARWLVVVTSVFAVGTWGPMVEAQPVPSTSPPAGVPSAAPASTVAPPESARERARNGGIADYEDLMMQDPTLFGAPPERSRERVWYGAQAWAVLAVSALLTPVYGLGAVGLVFGGPTVHWAHGHVGRGFAVLGMNLGLTAVGFGLGLAVGAAAFPRSEWGAASIALIGSGVGLLTANIVNAAALSDEDAPSPVEVGARRPPRRMLLPQLTLESGRAQFGLAGTF